jgi:hypothetical protein
MKLVKTVFVVLVSIFFVACASKGSNDLKSPCACGESTTHKG